MSVFHDISFINRLSIRLRNFSKKGSENVWNFSCPLCGDSKKNTKKARGYFFRSKQDRFLFKCYNCNESLSLERFIERLDPSLAAEYRTARFAETSNNYTRTSKPKEPEIATPKSLFDKSKLGQYFEEIRNLPKNHFAYQYLIQRQIPKNIIETELFFTSDFRAASESILATTGLGLSKETYGKMRSNDARLIIPFASADGKVIGYQGRTLDPTNPVKYITIKLDANAPKIYGLNRLDTTRDKIYVFEGPFDSMFIPNSVAVMDSQLYRVSELMPNTPKEKFVLCFDNEARNPDIVKAMQTAVRLGFSIVILPHSLGDVYEKNKDLNDLVIRGKIDPATLHSIIDKHTHKNNNEPNRFLTQIALNNWKKVS